MNKCLSVFSIVTWKQSLDSHILAPLQKINKMCSQGKYIHLEGLQNK